MNKNFTNQLKDIKLLVMDFDGVHTNGLVYVNEQGVESVVCSRVDSMGIELLRRFSDVKACVISKEKNPVVMARCKKLGLSCYQGVDSGMDKLEILQRIAEENNFSGNEIVYIGDDVNDIPCIEYSVGIAVANAHADVKRVAQYVCSSAGGQGAIREICELILKAKSATMNYSDYIEDAKNFSTQELFDLSGEVAVVTGGEGQLGRQYIKILSGAGAKTAVLDISGENPVDITNKEQVVQAFENIERDLGTPTILVNNAGIDAPPNAPPSNTGPFEDYPEDIWDSVIDSHLKGAFLVSQEFLRRIKKTNRNGSIVNISSTYGVVSPDQSLYDFRRRKGEIFFKPVAYSVAKSGMLNFTRWLAEYGAPFGVRANALVLGGVFNGQDEEFVEEYSKRTMLKRMAHEDEYNGAILFLASTKASSYMTGSILTVDGGWTAR